MMGLMVPETCWASNKICNKNHLLHLVGILFPQNNSLLVYCYFFCIIAPGKQMNTFLNENWSAVFNELSSSVFSAWSQIILTMFDGLYRLVPFDVLFPENLPKWLLDYIINST